MIDSKDLIAFRIKLAPELNRLAIFQSKGCCNGANLFPFAHVLVGLCFFSVDVLSKVKEIVFKILTAEAEHECIQDIGLSRAVGSNDAGKVEERSGESLFL